MESKSESVERARASLRRLTTEIDGLDEQAAQFFGLNRTDQHCIDVIVSNGPLTPSEIARATSLTSGGTTIALDRLERASMIRRRRNPADRRSILVEATDKPRRLGREFFGPLAEAERQLLSRFSLAEVAAITEFLDGLGLVLSQHRASQAAPAGSRGRQTVRR